MLETLEVDGDDVNGELWFQQDGAAAHAAAESVGCLESRASRTHRYGFWQHLLTSEVS